MLNLKIIAAGKLKELFYIDACIEYFKRLRTMAEVSVTEIAEESGRPDGLEREGDKICLLYTSERFYRVDKARSRERGGTGLGLAIAREIIEFHGGNISIRSKEGRGTSITVTLPKAPEDKANG